MTWRVRLLRGFTLIEMAIVLVVIGLVFSGGLVAIAPVVENSKISDTNAKMDRIEQALILYVIRYGCLPCPADPALATASADGGIAHFGTYASSGCGTCDASVTTQGVVPWINLGLAESDIVDGFGYRIDYAVTPALALANGMVRTPPSTYPGGTLTVTDVTPTTITSVAAYVLISHGPDHSLGYAAVSGVRTSDPNNSPNQTANSDGSPFIQNNPITTGGTSYFDDIVRFRTAPIIIQLCGTNACGNPA